MGGGGIGGGKREGGGTHSSRTYIVIHFVVKYECFCHVFLVRLVFFLGWLWFSVMFTIIL